MELPQETIHCIVDFVHSNDRRTLKTLRLLNRAWNISASLRLFNTVRLLIPEPPCFFLPICVSKLEDIDHYRTFISLLESSTETISHCVRRVFLGRTDNFGVTIPQQWQNDYAVVISSIVSRFTHMSDIVFIEIDWSTLTPSFSSFIFGICKSPKLEQIDFWSCSMPTVSTFLDILQASSNLKTLRLHDFKIEDLPDPKQHRLARSSSGNQYCTNTTTPLLHSLEVHEPSGHLFHVFKVDLKQLRLSYNDVSGAEFLKSVGQSLESLVIKLFPPRICLGTGEDIEKGLSTLVLGLSHCPHVQHLRISGLPWSFKICPSIYFRSLLAQTLDQSLPIEHLQLVVYPIDVNRIICANETTSPSLSADLRDPCCPVKFNHQYWPQCQHYYNYQACNLCCSGWFTVDDSLSRSRIFQYLKTLEISMASYPERFVGLSDLSDAFPKLKSKGVQVMWTYVG